MRQAPQSQIRLGGRAISTPSRSHAAGLLGSAVLIAAAVAAAPPPLRAQEFALDPIWIAGGVGSSTGEFGVPESVALDAAGRVVVTDKGRMMLHVYSAETGEPLFDVGRLGSSLGSFDRPNGIAVDAAGHVLVVEQRNQRVQVLDRDYRPLRSWGGSSRFQKPMGIAIDVAGRIYVTDEGRADVQAFDASGTFLFRFATSPLLDKVESIEVDLPGDRVLVCDEGRSRVNLYGLDGTFRTSFGRQGTGPGEFGNDTNAVRLDGRRRIYINDQGNRRIQVFTPETQFLASFKTTAGEFDSADGLALSEAQNIFLVADQGNNRVVAFDLGEIQCRLGRLELGALAAPAPAGLRAAFDDAPMGTVGLPWADGRLHFEARSVTHDPSRVETALVHVRSRRDRRGICVTLIETSAESGFLRGTVRLGETSDERAGLLATHATDTVAAHLAGERDAMQFAFVETEPPALARLAIEGTDPESPRIHDHPRLAWEAADPGRRPLTQHEVRCTDPSGGLLWSSGVQPGNPGAHTVEGPPLAPGATVRFEVRVAAGRAWSAWMAAEARRNMPPGPITSAGSVPAPSTRLTAWPPRFVIPMPADADGDALSGRIELRTPQRVLHSRKLVAVDRTWIWTPECRVEDNTAMTWRLCVDDGWDTVTSSWRALVLDSADEDPVAPAPKTPPDAAVVHDGSLEFAWHPAHDPDPGSHLEYALEWSRDPAFTNSAALAAGPATRAGWREPLADGPLYWRVRVRDATGRATIGSVSHIVLARTARIVLRADAATGPLRVELGMRAGAIDGAAGEDAIAVFAADASRFTTRAGVTPALARDLRAPRDVARDPLVFDLEIAGAGAGPVRVHAESVALPAGWRASLRESGGSTRRSWQDPGDLGPVVPGPDGIARFALAITRPQPRVEPGELSPAQTTAESPAPGTAASPATAASKPVVAAGDGSLVQVAAGTRLRFAAAGAGRTRVRIFDVRGRLVRQDFAAADGTWTWNGRGALGRRLPRGIYWLRGTAPGGAPAVRYRVLWAG